MTNLRILTLLSFIGLLALALISFYRSAQTAKKNEMLIEELKQKNQIQNGIIQTKNFQQKLIRNSDSNTNIVARNDWLQLLWSKETASN